MPKALKAKINPTNDFKLKPDLIIWLKPSETESGTKKKISVGPTHEAGCPQQKAEAMGTLNALTMDVATQAMNGPDDLRHNAPSKMP